MEPDKGSLICVQIHVKHRQTTYPRFPGDNCIRPAGRVRDCALRGGAAPALRCCVGWSPSAKFDPCGYHHRLSLQCASGDDQAASKMWNKQMIRWIRWDKLDVYWLYWILQLTATLIPNKAYQSIRIFNAFLWSMFPSPAIYDGSLFWSQPCLSSNLVSAGQFWRARRIPWPNRFVSAPWIFSKASRQLLPLPPLVRVLVLVDASYLCWTPRGQMWRCLAISKPKKDSLFTVLMYSRYALHMEVELRDDQHMLRLFYLKWIWSFNHGM